MLSIRIASRHFNPGVISTIVTVAFLYTMISLGNWQLDRAVFKEALQDKIESRKNLSAAAINDLPVSTDDRRYLPVKISGEFDREHSFLLDNKIFKGRVGYHVFTPLITVDSKAILVSRGFIDIGQSRQQLPEIITPTDKIEIEGLLDLPPSSALVLADNVQQTNKWPVVLQYVDLTELSQMVNYELYDMVVWLNAEQPGSLEYDLPVLNLNAAKNNGYAFQWFAMSLALFVIYIVVNTKKVK